MPKSVRRKRKARQEVEGDEGGRVDPKTRRVNRREAFLSKLGATQRRIKTDHRAKTAGRALATIDTLSDALKAYEAEAAETKQGKAEPARKAGKRKGALGNKKRKALQMAECALLAKVLEHPAVKRDACKAVSDHLRSTYAAAAAAAATTVGAGQDVQT